MSANHKVVLNVFKLSNGHVIASPHQPLFNAIYTIYILSGFICSQCSSCSGCFFIEPVKNTLLEKIISGKRKIGLCSQYL